MSSVSVFIETNYNERYGTLGACDQGRVSNDVDSYVVRSTTRIGWELGGGHLVAGFLD